jgi:hypothetical protein
MGNRFASGKKAIAECDRCGFRFKLKDLTKLIIKTKQVTIKVCPECWEPDQPQLQLGMYPVDDPQALREPRPDLSYTQSGYTGLQVLTAPSTNKDGDGVPGEGSRVFQWGWNPVGGSRLNDDGLTPNYLVSVSQVGTVTIVTT